MRYLKITTFAGGVYHLESTSNGYKIRDAKVAYMQTEILGKKVAEPKIGQPLVIYLNTTDVLYSSKIAEIQEYLTE